MKVQKTDSVKGFIGRSIYLFRILIYYFIHIVLKNYRKPFKNTTNFNHFETKQMKLVQDLYFVMPEISLKWVLSYLFKNYFKYDYMKYVIQCGKETFALLFTTI